MVLLTNIFGVFTYLFVILPCYSLSSNCVTYDQEPIYHMLCCYLSSWPMVGTQQTFDAEINPYLSGPSALKTPPYPKSRSLFNNPSSFQCHWAKKLELTLRTLVCNPIAAINLLYDLKQVIILLQVIFKSSLSPDPGLFPILLLLSPWSKLNRSNLVLTKSLCWDTACSLFRWTQCFPSVGDSWVVLTGGVRWWCPGKRDPSGQHCTREADGIYCWQPLQRWGETLCFVTPQPGRTSTEKQVLIVSSVCGVSTSSSQELEVLTGNPGL